MFWGHGFGMGVGWIGVLFGLLALAALVILVVRSFTTGPPPRSNTRAILEERLVRGEITPDQYREIVRALDETSSPPSAS